MDSLIHWIHALAYRPGFCHSVGMTQKKKTNKDTVKKRRTILVILSNRWNKLQTPHFLEIECDPKGNILKEKKLRTVPSQPRFDEVWENDEAKTDFAACHRFSRKYGHKLQKTAP